MSLHTCALCGHYTDLPDSLWMVTRPLSETAISREVTCCSPRCLVLWLEREHKPSGLGVAL